MMQTRESRDRRSLNAYPNIRTAAQDPRRRALHAVPTRRRSSARARGARSRAARRGGAALAAIFRRRSINDVAQALLDCARERAPVDSGGVAEEIEQYFEYTALTGVPATSC